MEEDPGPGCLTSCPVKYFPVIPQAFECTGCLHKSVGQPGAQQLCVPLKFFKCRAIPLTCNLHFAHSGVVDNVRTVAIFYCIRNARSCWLVVAGALFRGMCWVGAQSCLQVGDMLQSQPGPLSCAQLNQLSIVKLLLFS